MRDYVAQAGNVDVPRVAGGHRDPERVRALLTALARNVATEVSISVLARDAGGADESMGRDTVRDYLDALERLMVLEPVPAWSTHLRSKATLRGRRSATSSIRRWRWRRWNPAPWHLRSIRRASESHRCWASSRALDMGTVGRMGWRSFPSGRSARESANRGRPQQRLKPTAS